MKEIKCKHNAKCLNFYFYTLRNQALWSNSVLILSNAVGILLNLNLLQSDFSRPHFAAECSLTIFGRSRHIWADNLAPFSQSKC